MSNVNSPPADQLADPPAASERTPERSALPLGFGRLPSADATLPLAGTGAEPSASGERGNVAEPSILNPKPHPRHERDHALIDFLVRKAMETCMPCEPAPSLSVRGARQRKAKRTP